METIDIGYNTLVKIGEKTFAGVTQDDLTITGVTKESITKTDKGGRRKKVVRTDSTIKVAGLCATDDGVTSMSREDIMDLVLAKQELEITDLSGTTEYTATALPVGYSESTPADPSTDPTYSLDLELITELTKQGGA